jgi:hypothetical protein
MVKKASGKTLHWRAAAVVQGKIHCSAQVFFCAGSSLYFGFWNADFGILPTLML